MNEGVVRLGHRLEGSARVARLAAGLAARSDAQGLGGGFGQSIAGGRLATVAAGEGQTIFQLPEFLLQTEQIGFQSEHQTHERGQSALGHLPEFLPPAHARKWGRKLGFNG